MIAINLIFWSFLIFELMRLQKSSFIEIWLDNPGTIIWGSIWIVSCVLMISCPCLLPFSIYQILFKPRQSLRISNIFPEVTVANLSSDHSSSLQIGEKIRALDRSKEWNDAIVLEQTDEFVKVQFIGKSEQFDEWIQKNQGRISTVIDIPLVHSKEYQKE
jgi:hypothetical protein